MNPGYLRGSSLSNRASRICRCRKVVTRCCSSHSTTASSNLYELLGVRPSATRPDVKQAYRLLASRYHPDVNPNEDARKLFKALNLAYEVLTDTQLKQTYDESGIGALGPRFAYLNAFLKAPVPATEQAGDDLFIVAGLNLKEAVLGVEKPLILDVLTKCRRCEGSGTASATRCTVCSGSGQILRHKPHPLLSQVTQLGRCPSCAGSGAVSLQGCPACGGRGATRAPREVLVRIPAGVESGSVVKVAGQGDPGRLGGRTGDLYVKVMVHDATQVVRSGRDLVSELEVSVFDAMLGATLTVGTMKGAHQISVPAGTQHGDAFTVAGAGVPVSLGGVVEYGDHVFKVALRVPSPTSFPLHPAAARRKLQHLAALRAAAAAAGSGPAPP